MNIRASGACRRSCCVRMTLLPPRQNSAHGFDGTRIDAVLGNWSNIPDLLRLAGLDIPRDVGVATLDYNPHRGAIAGIRQSHELVGERAVEALALLMKTNQRGLISLPNTTLVERTLAGRSGSSPEGKVTGEERRPAP